MYHNVYQNIQNILQSRLSRRILLRSRVFVNHGLKSRPFKWRLHLGRKLQDVKSEMLKLCDLDELNFARDKCMEEMCRGIPLINHHFKTPAHFIIQLSNNVLVAIIMFCTLQAKSTMETSSSKK